MNNPRWVKLQMEGKIEEEEKQFFIVGAAIDCLLTSPERWEEDFRVVDAVEPTGLFGKFIKALPAGLTRSSDPAEYVIAYQKAGYRKSLEWVIDNFWISPEGVAYYEAKNLADDGKVIVPKNLMEQVTKAVELIQVNEYTAPFFNNRNIHQEVKHQLAIYFKYKGVDCKALLDGLLIDHKDKKIIPFDLKSTGKSVYSFAESYIQFGYYRQCAFYEQALLSEESPILDLLKDGYELEDFLFIVAETSVKSTRGAVIFKTNKHDRQIGLTGNENLSGIDKLLEDYLWHVETNKWDMPRHLYENKGVIDLKIQI